MPETRGSGQTLSRDLGSAKKLASGLMPRSGSRGFSRANASYQGEPKGNKESFRKAKDLKNGVRSWAGASYSQGIRKLKGENARKRTGEGPIFE